MSAAALPSPTDPLPGAPARDGAAVSRQRLAKLRHDLRTPINHIVGYSEMLLEEVQGQVSESFLRDLRKIRGGGEQLLALIQQHLNEESFLAARRDLHQLCHELRTPVNHIIGYSELLLDHCADHGWAAFQPDLRRINQAARTWLALMEKELIGQTGRDRALPPQVDPVETEALSRLTASLAIPHSPNTQHPARGQGRLLLADDDEGNRELLRRRLEKLGYQVVACGDGQEAFERARAEPFDLILLDMLMPGLDGTEVLARLKAEPALRHIPVIMISALDQMEGIVRCIELGAEDYLAKPFNPVFLRARLGAALEKKRLRDAEQVYLNQIETERAKSEGLLLNVLPRAIADRLKNGESVIVDSFPEVTVLFADLVGFTGLAAQMAPAAVVRLLNDIFTSFDELASRHGLEKIKTIGDAYMAVAGLPAPRPDHAAAAARMALDMQEVLRRFSGEPHTGLSMRIGLNTGPVIAGIIGRHKFSYDLWGDTVNTASRMESHAEPDTIQVTSATANLLERHFDLARRDAVAIKGKGQLTTYFVLGPKAG